MFAVDHWGVVPDIMTVAKGLTSGYVPMGAAIAKGEIARKFEPGSKQSFQHVVTFGGHAVASAAALVNLDLIERERLVENSAAMGQYLLEGLRGLMRHTIVGDVRGLGLMCAVELVRDRKTRARFGEEARTRLRKWLNAGFSDAGLLMMAGDRISIMPPLIVQRSDVERIVAVLDSTLAAVEHGVDLT
jgi:adenosylmethionine-8-amino-7-oxononanoate aminotransferase